VFVDATIAMVHLRYTWLISSTVTEIKSSDTYGVFADASVFGKTISLQNNTKINLSPNSMLTLIGNLKFAVADRDDVLRFQPVIYRFLTAQL